ncbi:polyprenyl synthetase family protein [Streptomyces sp. QH1-20]|uniref:polyprenyl synthetase family protein n=1 Tax=Streptomyces sp. QH1-20 TaxID=3240934 RepID=UPI0035147B78
MKVPSVIFEARQWAEGALQEEVGSLHPELAKVCGYVFGWRDEQGAPVQARGSRYLHAALAMITGDQLGRRDSALASAVAHELVHNLSLLHDDIIDDDDERRGRPAAHTVFGPSMAIIAGDAAIPLACGVLLREDNGRQAARMLTGTVIDVVGGWSQDEAMAAAADLDTDVQEILCGVGYTLGPLLLHSSVRVASVLCGGQPDALPGLIEAVGHAGQAWKTANDAENYWDTGASGKQSLADLRQGRITLPVVFAAVSSPSCRKKIEELWPRRTDEVVLAELAGQITASSAKQMCTDLAAAAMSRAFQAVDSSDLRPDLQTKITDLLLYITTRGQSHG